MMRVSQLLDMETNIDVIDDYDERCYIAFCGPMKLTDEGFKRFGKALQMKAEIKTDYILVHIEEGAEHEMENDAELVKDLFYAMAGYCNDDDYHKWFEEDDE